MTIQSNKNETQSETKPKSKAKSKPKEKEKTMTTEELDKLLIENMNQDPNEYQNVLSSIKFKLFLRNSCIDCKTVFKYKFLQE